MRQEPNSWNSFLMGLASSGDSPVYMGRGEGEGEGYCSDYQRLSRIYDGGGGGEGGGTLD